VPGIHSSPETMRHEAEPIRLFKSDFLEFFTHTHPAAVPFLFLPVILFFLIRGLDGLGASEGVGGVALAFAAGVVMWTFAEYVMHRYVFHYEPKGRVLERVWYLVHGVHHEQPGCKTRLVMPPILSIPLSLGFYALISTVVGVALGAPLWVAPLYAGFVAGYLAYDMLHYAEHHLPMKGGALRYLKRYHLLHHFKTPDDRFGVSSPLWDVIFGTLPQDSKRG
jgi:sterol desaturase/sphingolipid hydroxylase (fatty acid hydroxylase superfamily)